MNKTKHITFRCTEEQYKYIKATAGLVGESLSNFILVTAVSASAKLNPAYLKSKADKIKWQWESSPGYPPYTDDDGFEFPETPPSVSLAIGYKDGDTYLRNTVIIGDRTPETLTPNEKETMKDLLIEWLENHH